MDKETMTNVLILKFPYDSAYGGGEKHTISLVRGLISQDFNFYLASSCPVLLREFKKRGWHNQKTWAGFEPVSKWSAIVFPLLAPLTFPKLACTVFYYRFFKQVRIIYCLSLTEKLLIAFWAKLLGVRVFWTEHTTIDRWLTKNPWRWLYVWHSRLVTVVPISQAIKNQLLEIGVKEKNIKVIYPGIDLGKIDIVRRNFERRFKKSFIIGTICRLEPEKGIEYLMQATKRALPLIPNISLIIVGDGGARKNLEWLAKKLEIDQVTQFVGFQHNIEKWYPLFDLFALPSAIRESFGISLVEALAFEVPVVASQMGGVTEIIEEKETGYLVPPKNSDALSEKIIYIYKNYQEARQAAKRGRLKVEKMFSLDLMVEEYYKLLFRKKQ
ncbi:MAG: glycosyltransferase family 4 protein [Patescibacteria group bacterium]